MAVADAGGFARALGPAGPMGAGYTGKSPTFLVVNIKQHILDPRTPRRHSVVPSAAPAHRGIIMCTVGPSIRFDQGVGVKLKYI